jgi:hypothetical protein
LTTGWVPAAQGTANRFWLGDYDDARRSVEQSHCRPGCIVDADPWIRWQRVRVIGARSVQLPVPDHEAPNLQHEAFMLVDDLAPPGRPPSDALRNQPARSRGLRRGDQVARTFGPHPVVGGGELP